MIDVAAPSKILTGQWALQQTLKYSDCRAKLEILLITVMDDTWALVMDHYSIKCDAEAQYALR